MKKQKIDKKGHALLDDPRLNKGTAFSSAERTKFELDGLLPHKISHIEDQSQRMIQEVRRKDSDLDRSITLVALQNRNETLFYKVLSDNLEELMPIVYTPTVGKACEKFSQIFRKVRGLWITPEHKGKIAEILSQHSFSETKLIVATDNESILGLGDQGAGGIAIPVGKLSLYVVGAGIHPKYTLPVSLDLGTDNQKLLDDPQYLGWKGKRLRGKEYYELLDEFVDAVKKVLPGAVIQWEDFKNEIAFEILKRYQKEVPSFNDDIQGTSSVALACLLNACQKSQTKIKDHRILIIGAGAAGTGIGKLLRNHLLHAGLSEPEVKSKLALFDSEGLLREATMGDSEDKKLFAWDKKQFEDYQLNEQNFSNLDSSFEKIRPTVVIGTSGQPDLITQRMVEIMCEETPNPIVFPFSNPTYKAEAKPENLYKWSQGTALIATGSPFAPVKWDGKLNHISQGNNVFIFPGVGLGAILANCSYIPEGIFYTAARALETYSTKIKLEDSELLPSVSELKSLTIDVALEVWKKLDEMKLAQNHFDSKTAREEAVKQQWEANYAEYF